MMTAVESPRLRTIREFAEQEIILPTGPFANQRFKVSRNPYLGLWFDAIDSGLWQRFVATGPTQSGKTLGAFVIPIMYHLFEVRETVVCGIPTLDMIADKWTQDLLPAIASSRYRDLLPRSGAGSRGGDSTAIQFAHGPTLRFMSAGGGDKTRAGFTSRVLAVTETDGMDEAGGSSREADKVSQFEGRLRAFQNRARSYFECTVSLESGRTWREYTGGTESRIAIQCPHCREFVTPEREHLSGWRECETVIEAGRKSAIGCPSCGSMWTETERIDANRSPVMLHGKQTISQDGIISGIPPETDTLGFRWSAANNLLVKASVIGQDEWKAARDPDETNAEKKMLQFVWAKPFKPDKADLTQIDAHAITQRVSTDHRGIVPADVHRITTSIDIGKWLCHWICVGWGPNATPHVIDYGRLEVPTSDLGEELAVLSALRAFRDICDTGWPTTDKPMKPAISFVDAGWNQPIVLRFCSESPGYFPSKGRGIGQIKQKGPGRETGSKVVGVGDGYEIVNLPGQVVPFVEVDVDKWKSWVHARIQTPIGKPGALTIFASGANEHLAFAKHLTAERKIEEFVAGKGLVTRWEAMNRNNHWLDALMNACAAGHAVGERLIDQPVAIVTMPARPQAEPTDSEWLPDRTNWMKR